MIASGRTDAVIMSAPTNRPWRRRLGSRSYGNDGGDRGQVQVTREGRAGNRACRDFQHEIVVGGRQQNAHGTACQPPDGSWELVGDR